MRSLSSPIGPLLPFWPSPIVLRR